MENKEILLEAYSLGMMQNEYEISNALDFVKKINIKNFLEIGTDQGGTFLAWSRISDPGGLKISVDWAYGPWGKFESDFNLDRRNAEMRKMGQRVHILDGDSHSEFMFDMVKSILGDEKLDFLFIDGDHSYLGTKLDYYMYKQFVRPGGWIGFHDIKNTDFHHSSGCYVDQFWEELREEKVWYFSDSELGGIGFVKN